MGAFPNKETQFKLGQSGNSRGRPKSQLANFEQMTGQEYGIQLTKQDVAHLMQWIIEQPFKDLELLKENPEVPAFIKVLINALEQDLKNGTIRTLEIVFDRVLGRPVQATAHSLESGMSLTEIIKKANEPLEIVVSYQDEKSTKGQ